MFQYTSNQSSIYSFTYFKQSFFLSPSQRFSDEFHAFTSQHRATEKFFTTLTLIPTNDIPVIFKHSTISSNRRRLDDFEHGDSTSLHSYWIIHASSAMTPDSDVFG